MTRRNAKCVVVKTLRLELSAIPQIRERFLRKGYLTNPMRRRGAVME